MKNSLTTATTKTTNNLQGLNKQLSIQYFFSTMKRIFESSFCRDTSRYVTTANETFLLSFPKKTFFSQQEMSTSKRKKFLCYSLTIEKCYEFDRQQFLKLPLRSNLRNALKDRFRGRDVPLILDCELHNRVKERLV